MTAWATSYASTELQTTAAVVAKTAYLVAGLTGQLETSLGLDLGAELDTSG